MRYLLAGLLVLILVPPSYGQGEVVPDTLSWQGYYPLEVGNVWEWETEILVAYSAQDQREIIGDTLINGKLYFVQSNFFSQQDPLNGRNSSGRDTTFLRYDSLKTRVVELLDNGEEKDYTCDLGADFGTTIPCDLFDPDTFVAGAYADEDDFLLVEGDQVPFDAAKGYGNIGGGITYYHGVGVLPGIGDGSAGTIRFNYLRLGGKEYGERVVFVGVEDQAIPDKDRVELYPNPANDRVMVDLGHVARHVSIRVYDVLGRRALGVQDCSGTSCIINSSKLVPGTYFVQINSELGRSSLKSITIVR